MISSGTTALATSGDTPITLLPATFGPVFKQLTVINNSAIACFVTWDGTNWLQMPAGCKSRVFVTNINNSSVQLKRVAGGTDVTGIFAEAV